jgi:hypothetical protein
MSAAAAEWDADSAVVAEANRIAEHTTKSERSHIRSQWPVTVTHWRNDQIPDRRINRRQRLRDTASVRAVGDIQFCCDFLMRQMNQAIATCWLA